MTIKSNKYFCEIWQEIEDKEIKIIDFRFSDLKTKWLNVTYNIENRDKEYVEGILTEIFFDGSSVEGWMPIHKSDMILKPDLSTYFVDAFASIETLVVICDVVNPETQQGYIKDPRNTALRAEEYLKETKIGDEIFFGPEPEFFIFDNVKFKTGANQSSFKIDSQEDPDKSDFNYESGNFGHRSQAKAAYFDCPPLDSSREIRSEIAQLISEVGIKSTLHHHEVANSQHEVGFEYDTLTKTADNVQKFKYIVRNAVNSYGKTATFMPKPIYGDNGSGMHIHQSIWKNGKNLFAGNKGNNLSQEALYYIGGVIKHAKSINAFSNPSINSYKRLVPGFEAPVILAYASKNRSASIRIPFSSSENGRRIETRFPDPAANPYLVMSALLMAGLDGIKNKINPGDASEKDLYDLSDEESSKFPKVASSLEEAIDALDQDRQYLKQGGVFNDEQIDAYIKLKRAEIKKHKEKIHPLEFELYYNV